MDFVGFHLENVEVVHSHIIHTKGVFRSNMRSSENMVSYSIEVLEIPMVSMELQDSLMVYPKPHFLPTVMVYEDALTS